MKKTLPEFELTTDTLDIEGISTVSFVLRPANEKAFIAFSAEQAPVNIRLSEDGEQRQITGVLLVPNQRIYRRNGDDEFNVYFTEQGIRRAAKALAKRGAFNSINSEHSTSLQGAYLNELWFAGVTDKSKELGFDVPKGTLMVSYWIEDDALWNDAKSGTFTGFSIEGLFTPKPVQTALSQTEEEAFFSIVNDAALTDEEKEARIKSWLEQGQN